MQNPFPHIIDQHTFWVSPERSLYWEDQNTLIVTDLHMGKTGHFRKEGIVVPQGIYKADLQRLMAQLSYFKAERLIIVGDLTHSTVNKELDLFKRWRKDFSMLHIDLVKGNHDILDDRWYSDTAIETHAQELTVNGFCFRHEQSVQVMNESGPCAKFTFSGHIHPGITITGRGKQSLRFPCFYFTTEHCILPAFSRFTGTYSVSVGKGEIAYAIVDNKLVRMG
jgi:DNA ligase-associated metallophosphoesterase